MQVKIEYCIFILRIKQNKVVILRDSEEYFGLFGDLTIAI